MNDRKIGIVTVLYNSESVLEDFFHTLNEQTYNNFILYLVDNCSTDQSVKIGYQYASEVGFKCKWLLQKENLGVAEGNNIGIKAALADKCDYILLANNDIVLESSAIEKLYTGMCSMNAMMVVPKIYYWNSDKIIWMAGGKFLYMQCTTHQTGIDEHDKGQYDKSTFITYAPTCFMLIDSSVFERVGFMDSRYFVYYDDTDFVWRAVERYHIKLAYIYDSVIWHKVSSSTGGNLSNFSIYYLGRNNMYFALKNMPLFRKVLFLIYLTIHFFVKKIFLYNRMQRKLLLSSYKDGVKLYLKNRE